MQDVFHSGTGNFGIKIHFKNGTTQFHWKKTKKDRDKSYRENKNRSNVTEIFRVER